MNKKELNKINQQLEALGMPNNASDALEWLNLFTIKRQAQDLNFYNEAITLSDLQTLEVINENVIGIEPLNLLEKTYLDIFLLAGEMLELVLEEVKDDILGIKDLEKKDLEKNEI